MVSVETYKFELYPGMHNDTKYQIYFDRVRTLPQEMAFALASRILPSDARAAEVLTEWDPTTPKSIPFGAKIMFQLLTHSVTPTAASKIKISTCACCRVITFLGSFPFLRYWFQLRYHPHELCAISNSVFGLELKGKVRYPAHHHWRVKRT